MKQNIEMSKRGLAHLSYISQKEKEKKPAVDDDDDDFGYRRPSFLSSLHNTSLAQLNDTTTKSTCDYLQERLNRLEGRSNEKKVDMFIFFFQNIYQGN